MPRSTFAKSIAWIRNSSAMGSLRFNARALCSRLPSWQSVNTLKVPDDGMAQLPAALRPRSVLAQNATNSA